MRMGAIDSAAHRRQNLVAIDYEMLIAYLPTTLSNYSFLVSPTFHLNNA